MKKLNVSIIGVGGIGGRLASILHRINEEKHDKPFNIRLFGKKHSEHTKKIKKNGLSIYNAESESTHIFKVKIYDDFENGMRNAAADDLIILGTKNFDIDKILPKLSKCMNKDCLLLTLQNGLSTIEKCEQHYNGRVLGGYMLCSSHKKEAGVIAIDNNHPFDMSFDLLNLNNNKNNTKLIRKKEYIKRLLSGKVNFTEHENILIAIWEKFMIASSLSALSLLYNANCQRIMDKREAVVTYKKILLELYTLGREKNIPLARNCPKKILDRSLRFIHSHAKPLYPSFYLDFLNRRETEFQDLITYVVVEAEKLELRLPIYTKIYQDFKYIEQFTMIK